MNYPASNLTVQKGKFYVVCTIPTELRSALGGRKQIKRSTGTSDEKIARGLQHEIAADIYTVFDGAASAASPAHQALQAYLTAIGKTKAEADALLGDADLASPHALEDLLYKMRSDHVDGPEFDQAKGVYLEAKEAEPDEEETSNSIKFSELSDQYIENKSWGRIRSKIDAQNSHLDFINRMGDLRIDQVTKIVGYKYADRLVEAEYANKSIRNRVSAVSQAFLYAEKRGLLETNPLRDIKLVGYGDAPVAFKKFEDDQLTALFAQKDMPDDIRLALTMLITTGMRLDEAALMTFENIKTTKGIKHFDLTGAIVKNTGSKRLVPIIPKLDKLLPKSGKGRLFSWAIDRDGKSAVKSSQAIMPWVRNITKEEKQAVHSLRGTLKDLLRDAGVTKEITTSSLAMPLVMLLVATVPVLAYRCGMTL